MSNDYIINDLALQKDCIQLLIQNKDITKEEAEKMLTSEVMCEIRDAMFQAQSDYINNINKEEETIKSLEIGLVPHFVLEPSDIKVGNFITSPRFGKGRITKIIDKDWFEADMFEKSGCCGPILMHFMMDGKSHWNDKIPSVFKYLKIN